VPAAPSTVPVPVAGGEPLIRCESLAKRYEVGGGTVHALRELSLSVMPGEFVAVMGPSGSGKSTTMNILGCLDVPSAGSFLFKGHRVEALDRDDRALLRRKYLGFVFQGFNLLARTTALENVELPLVYRGDSRKARHDAAMAALDKVGLAPWWDHTPAELSGGQQQRVAIARALVTNPDVLLADEPTGNLDSERSLEIMELLTDLNRKTGITVLMVTHEGEMAAYANTIIHFKDGLVERIETGKRTVAVRA
jgi:putative ABC transport system ATP-binding protein